MIISIAGADESVEPEQILELSKEFPFVEWGILWSMSRTRSPRYPGSEWTMDLAVLATRNPELSLCHHYCGQVSKEFQIGEIPHALTVFRRIQINGFVPEQAQSMPSIDQEIILQCRDDLANHCLDYVKARGSGKFSLLLDNSGGNGEVRDQWPSIKRLPFGYAGGIGPENVQIALQKAKENGASWIDMESGVRTNNEFDLGKVRSVLTQARTFLQKENIRW